MVQLSYMTYNSYNWRSISLSQHNHTEQRKIRNAISEVSKGDCIIMGDFNHGNMIWDSQHSTGVEDQNVFVPGTGQFLNSTCSRTNQSRMSIIVLSSQKEFVDNVVIHEPLGSSDHNKLHFNINIKSDKIKVKQSRRDFRRGEVTMRKSGKV